MKHDQRQSVILSKSVILENIQPGEKNAYDSEIKYHTIIEKFAEGFTLVDDQGRMVDWNQAMERITGIERTEIIGMPIWEVQFRITHQSNRTPEIYEAYKKKCLDMLNGCSDLFNKPLEGRIQRVDGQIRIIRQNVFPIQFQKKRYIASITQDITEAKQAEIEIQNSQQKFKSLFASSNEGICLHELIYDEEGKAVDYRILDVNPAYEIGTSIIREQAIGALASKLYGVSDPPYLDTYVTVAQTGEPTSFETYFPPMDKHFKISVFSPAKDQFATLFIDITQRKRAEDQITKAAQRLADAEATAHLGSWEMDIDTGKAVWSDEFFRICGYEPQAFDPSLEMGMKIIHPVDREWATQVIQTAIDRCQNYDIEKRVVRPNGEVRWVHSLGKIIEENQRPIKVIGSFLDITERKITEAELEKYREHLEDLVKERTTELEMSIIRLKHAEEQIKKSLSEKEMLLREVHHRVKNNLNMINNILYFQSKLLDEQTAAAFKECQGRILSMAYVHEHLYRSWNLAQVDMLPYIMELTSELGQSYGNNLIDMQVSVENIMLDIDQAIPCGLIIHELVSNAYKHAFSGQISVGNIIVKMFREGPKILLEISDTGKGIPGHINMEEVQSLGLRLIRMFVKQLKGQLTVQSHLNQGTTFIMSFVATNTKEKLCNQLKF